MQQPRQIATTEHDGQPVQRRRPERETGQQQVHVRQRCRRRAPCARGSRSGRITSRSTGHSPCLRLPTGGGGSACVLLRPKRTKCTAATASPPSIASVAEPLEWPLPDTHRQRHRRILRQPVQLRADRRTPAPSRPPCRPRPAGRTRPPARTRWPSAASTRVLATASMSSFVPNCRQLVGQAFTHAGCRPTDTRSTHSVHL